MLYLRDFSARKKKCLTSLKAMEPEQCLVSNQGEMSATVIFACYVAMYQT